MVTSGGESTEQFLSGGGEMGKLIRSMDWSKTALGPVESWPQSLRTSVSLCLSSTFPILIAWGPETIQIYNDSYRPICGAKHPESMGQNFRICWETALPVVGDKFTRGQQGEGTYITDQRMFLDRYGYLEESWMTFSFAPIRDESGGVGGIFHPITESTEKMLSARRTKVLRDLGAALGKAKTVEEIGAVTVAQYSEHAFDLPFLLFYQADGSLISSAGQAPGVLTVHDWPRPEDGPVEIQGLPGLLGTFHCGPYEQAPHTAMVLPVRITGQAGLFGYLVAGVSACRAMDAAYWNFYEQLAATFNTAVTNVYAYEQEQQRAEALAAIDRSKTAFFSNVSHEFRTPLTLMLGPLEDLLRQELDGHTREQVDATHRNALRLLKLVNNLLDYSRVEAGRVRAVYEPLDIAGLTADLASSFRSIIEKAGMALEVSAPVLNGQYYVDPQMWEKIVLNLLSNAFKYTLAGTIRVSLVGTAKEVVLEVADTGVGIPAKELPHMFERFHRVERSAGRTHEGTGIGLSLVSELVALHGGTITVDSVEGVGSTFRVRIPSGSAHLPQAQVRQESTGAPASGLKDAFIKEAYSLLGPEAVPETAAGEEPVSKQHTILVVDDNADMRAYLERLLEPYFTVATANNGQEALDLVGDARPALVLSDIMMPVLDGKGLLAALRGAEATASLPVIFLSARAGEEARIDGLEAGADDYLVKPFSAAELLTKVRAQIHISQARGSAEQRLRDLLSDAPVAIAVYRGPEHVVELANQRMLAYWDRPAEAILGRPVFGVMTGLAEQGFKGIMDEVYASGRQVSVTEAPAVLQRGGNPVTVYLNLTIEPLRDEAGLVTGSITVAADVTEQVLSRREVEQTRNTLELAIRAAQLGIWRAEWGSDRLEVSEAAARMHGLPQGGTYSFEATAGLILPEHRERVLAAIGKAVAEEGHFHEDLQLAPADGSPRRWLSTMGMTERDASGKLTVIGTVLDITERKADDERKNDFIGMVSHELKTPLTSLSGYTQIGQQLARAAGGERFAPVFEKSLVQVRKMTALINGFLNVSRLGSGKILLQPAAFRLDELLAESAAEFGLVAGTTVFELSAAPLTVVADREKIGTVLSNLLGNALKYAPGSARVRLSAAESAEGTLVSVQDEGKGIPPEDLGKVFERYYRATGHLPQQVSGFGIGLYLCAEIIRQHGGRIWAENVPEGGAVFRFLLPR